MPIELQNEIGNHRDPLATASVPEAPLRVHPGLEEGVTNHLSGPAGRSETAPGLGEREYLRWIAEDLPAFLPPVVTFASTLLVPGLNLLYWRVMLPLWQESWMFDLWGGGTGRIVVQQLDDRMSCPSKNEGPLTLKNHDSGQIWKGREVFLTGMRMPVSVTPVNSSFTYAAHGTGDIRIG